MLGRAVPQSVSLPVTHGSSGTNLRGVLKEVEIEHIPILFSFDLPVIIQVLYIQLSPLR
jgi:hypothetical protein